MAVREETERMARGSAVQSLLWLADALLCEELGMKRLALAQNERRGAGAMVALSHEKRHDAREQRLAVASLER